jgi:hypothetical protein
MTVAPPASDAATRRSVPGTFTTTPARRGSPAWQAAAEYFLIGFRSGTEPTKFRFSATVIWRCFQPRAVVHALGKKARPLASSRAGFRGHGPALGVGASWRGINIIRCVSKYYEIAAASGERRQRMALKRKLTTSPSELLDAPLTGVPLDPLLGHPDTLHCFTEVLNPAKPGSESWATLPLILALTHKTGSRRHSNVISPLPSAPDSRRSASPDYSSRFKFRFPQCMSLRSGLNTRSTRRFSALSMPMLHKRKDRPKAVSAMCDGMLRR